MRFDVSQQETMKTEEDRIKLFLLHIVLLNKLPLKYRAQAINSTLLKEFYKTKGGTDYPFHEVSEHKWFLSIREKKARQFMIRTFPCSASLGMF